MNVGVMLPQNEIGDDPLAISEFARAVQAGGFSFIVASDHVLGADVASRPGWMPPYSSADAFHEVLVLFGFLAGVVGIELVTGVIALPQRQAALVAKQAAEVDVLTRGRLRIGVGIGWNPVEYEALGLPFASRAAMYEEQIHLMRLLWTNDIVTFSGRFHTVDRAGMLPRPVQQPIPVWLGGGMRRPVLERIGRIADGWMCIEQPGSALLAALDVVRSAAASVGRDPYSIGLQGTVRLDPGSDIEGLHDQIARWESIGASHVAVSTRGLGLSPAEHIATVRALGTHLLGDPVPTGA